MYKKIVILTFIVFCYFSKQSFVFALENIPEKPVIIPRESWGANELYTELNSSYWKGILERRKNAVDTRTSEQIKKDREDYKKSITYINQNFSNQNTVTKTQEFDMNSGERFAWPLKYTDYVNAIVIHHTHSDYESSVEGMKDIYRYHSINRAWGDIGYNYVIGYDGEIFEGRKGGEYVAAAHSKWNNYSTLGIAVMGNYHSEGINKKQYNSLEKLIQYYTWYYGIDLSKKYYYHTDCAGDTCDIFPLETYLDSTLVGHRDTGHTSCPGDKLYEQIQEIREKNLEFTKGFTPIQRGIIEKQQTETYISTVRKYIEVFEKYSDSDLELIGGKIEELLSEENLDQERRKKIQIIRLGVILSMKD